MSSLVEFCWMWIFPWFKLSWHSCSVWDNLGGINWFWPFLSERLFSFNPKGFYSYARSCNLYERRNCFCMGLIAKKFCGFLPMFLTGFTYNLSYFFFFYRSSSLSLYMVFGCIPSNIDDICSTHLSANAFAFRDFNVHHKDCLTYSFRSGDLNQMVKQGVIQHIFWTMVVRWDVIRTLIKYS